MNFSKLLISVFAATVLVACEGPAGPAGEQGAPGQAGAQGAPGAKGDPGPKGDTGAKGETGAKGDPGDPSTGGRGIKKYRFCSGTITTGAVDPAKLGYIYQVTLMSSGDVFITAELYISTASGSFQSSNSVWYKSIAQGATTQRIYLDSDYFGSESNDGYFTFETLTPGNATLTAHDADAPGAASGVKTYPIPATDCSET